MRVKSLSAVVVGLTVLMGSTAFAQALPRPVGDLAAGQKAFEAKCRACHKEGGVGGPMAPDLRGVYGRASGKASFNRYSANMKTGKIVWTQLALDTYLQGPSKVVPGTIMAIAPVAPADRKNIIAYMATLK